MKTLRKSMLLVLVAVFSLAVGLFAAACGGSKITVSYDLGTGAAATTNEVTPGAEMEMPAPSREGFFFGGWYENAQFTGEALQGKTTAPEKDTTYYARWLKGYNLTLKPNGGMVNGSTEDRTFSVPETGNLLEWIGKNTNGNPQRGSLTFGAWLNGETEIGESDVMPSADLVLTAGFKVDYSVEVYAQTAPHGTQYEKSEELSFTDSGYLNTTIDLRQHDFVNYIVNEDYASEELPAKVSGTLSENSSENAFRVYCDRAQFSLVYNVNLPTGGLEFTGKMTDSYFTFGESATVSKNHFEITGYRFTGWSSSANGSVEFMPGDTISSGDHILYAVWEKGYGDVFGSTDYIFFPTRATDPEAVLVRGGYEFAGQRGNVDQEMHFSPDPAGSFVSFRDGQIIAKLIGEKFSLYFADRIGEYTYYEGYYKKEGESHFNESIKLTLDGFNTATLDENGSTKSGTYEFDPEKGEFVLKLRGSSDRNFTFGVQGDKKVFSYLGREKGEYSQFVRAGVGGTYYLGTQSFELDGYGNAVRNVEGYAPQYGTYEAPDMNDANPIVTMHFGSFDARICLDIINSADYDTCVVVDDSLNAQVFTKDDETLQLDGIGAFADSAIYTHDGQTEQFDYYYESTLLGAYVHLTLNFDEEHYCFRLDEENHTFSVDEVETKTYQLVIGNGSYNSLAGAYLVLYDEAYTEPEAGDNGVLRKDATGQEAEKDLKVPDGAMRAEIYINPANANGGCIYKGYTYTDPNYGLPRFHTTWWMKGRADSFYTDFMYWTNTNFAQGPLFYIFLDQYVSIDSEGKPIEGVSKTSSFYTMWDKSVNYDKRFDSYYFMWNSTMATAPGSGFEGFGNFFVDENGKIYEGSIDYYVLSGTEQALFEAAALFDFTYRDEVDPLQFHHFYFAANIDETYGGTFVLLDSEPIRLMLMYDEMKANTFSAGYNSLFLLGDKNQNAVYFRSEEDYSDNNNGVNGRYDAIGDQNGRRAYRFTPLNEPDVQPFEFTIEELGEGWQDGFLMYRLYNVDDDKVFTIEGGGTFAIDGFGYAAYTDKDGKMLEGGYIYSDGREQIALYTPTDNGISLDYAFTISPDDENVLIPQKEEEKSSYFVLFNSAGVFPDGFAQAAVLFHADEGTIEITEIGEYIWYTQGHVNDDGSIVDSYHLFASGTYVLVDDEDHLYDLTLVTYDFHSGDVLSTNVKWRVRLEQGYCFLMDAEDVYGSYANEDSAVFYLDGWGNGCYIDPMGNRYEGSHNIIGFGDNDRYFYGVFGGVEENPELLYAARYDKETKTFVITNDPEKDGWVTYYAEDFGAIEFCQVFAIDNAMIGYWFLDENDKLLIYELDWESGYQRIDSQYPTPDFDDKNEVLYYDASNQDRGFYRWNEGDKFTFTGKVVFDAFKGQTLESGKMPTEINNLTLEFVPDGTALLNAPATMHFKYGDKEQDIQYTIVVSHPTTAQNANGYLKAEAYYDDVPFYIELNYTHANEGGNTFVFHAAGADYVWSDFLSTVLPDYVLYTYGSITSGLTYSIGPIEWKFDEWDPSKGGENPDMLISCVLYVPDENGKLLTFSMFYEDVFGKEETDDKGGTKLDESKIVTHDATLSSLVGFNQNDLPVYEVKFKGDDGRTYSVWLEKLTDTYGNWSSLIYAVNVYNETQGTGDNSQYTYKAWQFCGAYYASFEQMSIYTLDIVKKEGDKEVSVLEGYNGASWFDNDVIFYYADENGAPLASVKEPEPTTGEGGTEGGAAAAAETNDKDLEKKKSDFTLVHFDFDEKTRAITGATHTKDVKYVELKAKGNDTMDGGTSEMTFKFFISKGADGKIDKAYINGLTWVVSQTDADTGNVNKTTNEFSNELTNRVNYQRGRKSKKEADTFLFYFTNPVSITIRLSGDYNNPKVEYEMMKLDFEGEEQASGGGASISGGSQSGN